MLPIAHRSRRFVQTLIPLMVLAALLTAGWTISATGGVKAGPSARDLYNRAAGLAQAGRCAQAVPLYTQAINLNHMYVAALQGRAQCAQTLGADDVAINDYTAALRLDPRNYGLLLARAGAEQNNGSSGRAQSDALAALRLVPPQVPSYLSVAALLSSVADLTDAARVMTLAVLLLPHDATLYAQRAGYEAAIYDYTSAEADYQRALTFATANDKPTLYSNLAGVQDQAGDYTGARKSIGTAITMQPRNTGFYLTAAGIERDAFNYRGAASLYQQALRHGAHSTDALRAWEGYGDMLAAMNKNGEAARAYRSAMGVTPNRADRARLQSKIKALGT